MVGLVGTLAALSPVHALKAGVETRVKVSIMYFKIKHNTIHIWCLFKMFVFMDNHGTNDFSVNCIISVQLNLRLLAAEMNTALVI